MRTPSKSLSILLGAAGFYAAAAAFLPSLSSADGMVAPPPPITAADRAERVASARTSLERYPAMFDQCYARAGGARPDVVSLRFDLRANGRAQRVQVVRDHARNPALVRCLSAALRRFQWSPSRIASISVTHRFTRSATSATMAAASPVPPPASRGEVAQPSFGCAAVAPGREGEQPAMHTACAPLPPHLQQQLMR